MDFSCIIQSQSPTPAIGSNDATRITVAASSNPSGKNWGYVRVSTREQNETRQLIALHEFGISQDCVYTDKQSGKDFKPLLDFRIILKKSLVNGRIHLNAQDISRHTTIGSDMLKSLVEAHSFHHVHTSSECRV